jgi:hypothetical protein
MWPFQKTATLDANASPETSATPAESAADRETEAHSAVVALKAQLAELDRAILTFKTKYRVRTDRFSRLLSIECPGISSYEKVHTEWRILLHKRDSLVPAWHNALKTLAEAKQAAKETA